MEIGGWLRGLGLGQYEAAFRDNSIGADVLPDLTESDLGQLGVTLGDRKRLLRAIASLGAAEPAKPTSPASPPLSTEAAERRQLTVMFCDLIGSTALSAQLDPEDLRGVIGAYHRCCAELVERHDGFVAKYMGDGVLAYFGYPQAHERDAERAVEAGLAIVDAVPKLETAAGSPLHVRLGIATGIVVVGDLLGSGEAQERSIVGDTPNLAARLQGIAEPDSVVIADGTRKLLGNLFELKDLGALDLKGVAWPARAWAAVRASSAESRFEALHASGLTTLVGREEESELLLRRWTRAKAGEGQVVLLSGEPGIGKSRLTAELLQRLTPEPHILLRYFCSPQHTYSELHPIIGSFERAAGLSRDDGPNSKLDKLDALLARSATSREDAALLAEMLSLPNDGRYPVLELTPQQRRQMTLAALIAQIEALEGHNPVLMIFEDVHWADPTSLEALNRLLDRIQTLRVLLIVTSRTEFELPWIGPPHVRALTLDRLARSEVSALVDCVAGNKSLPAAIHEDIVERTDGIPLFVEEMTKAVLEAEHEGAAAGTIATAPTPIATVPASLQASLMARLDRLGRAKEVAQIGAAIGREFTHALLASVAREAGPELESTLDRLIQSGLLSRQGAPPRATYLFKHALVQDVAYGTLLREPRRALHARIAEALESQLANIIETRPELLARHCTEAGQIEKAAGLWGKAGQRSLARSALIEAEAQFSRALAQITVLPGTTALRRQQIELQVGLANAQMHAKGQASAELKASLDQARLLIEHAEALGEQVEDPLVLFSVLYLFWSVNLVAFNADVLRETASQFLALAGRQRATAPLMIGHRLMGSTLVQTGDIAEGRAHLDRAIALYDPVEHRSLSTRFGQDVRVVVLSWRALSLWLLGFPDAARTDAAQAVRCAREIGHAATLMYALATTSSMLTHSGDFGAVTAQADELVALAGDKSALGWKVWGMMFQGSVFALTGQASNAVESIAASNVLYGSLGANLGLPFQFSCLAWAQAGLGLFADARRSIDEALTGAAATGERWCDAEIHRIAGEIELLSPERDAAKSEVHFERALEIAWAKHARSWELRASMSMARLWRDQGKRSQARDLLAPVYGWFTEGFDTLDLKKAKALLVDLAS